MDFVAKFQFLYKGTQSALLKHDKDNFLADVYVLSQLRVELSLLIDLALSGLVSPIIIY
jgi:hypothetical protein